MILEFTLWDAGGILEYFPHGDPWEFYFGIGAVRSQRGRVHSL